ncbi:hypothetical protein [Sporosarcina sp. FSL K6-5500]|uniref:hypothetical protein n=1 Tax=Sporosarcina sp. FSL K6-5500 TaxID=2921558 RepID=UPI0030F51770
MKINTSYPYPVLYIENDDYVESTFTTQYVLNESFGQVEICTEFQLKNDVIKRYIEEGSFSYLLRIECPQTSFRKAYEIITESHEISIPSNLLRGKIEIYSFIIAKEKVENYENDCLNEWYLDTVLTFEKGNLIAIGEAIEIQLFEDNMELMDLPSIVTVRKSLKGEYMDVELHSNTITISLPQFEYNQYASNANSRIKHTILSMVIVPSLVYVFSRIQEGGEDLEEYVWYQVLEKIFEKNNYRLADVGTDRLSALQAAQLVLRKPLKSSFEEIEKLNRVDD